MFGWKKKPKKVEIKYYRIKKPKHNEMLLFTMPPGSTQETLHKFGDVFKKCIEDDKPYIITTLDIDIIKANKNIKINWQKRYEDAQTTV